MISCICLCIVHVTHNMTVIIIFSNIQLFFSINERVRQPESYCNVFDFLLGVLVYNTTDIDPMIELILTIDFPRSNLTNKKAYNISLDPFVDNKFDTVAEREGIYAFCSMSYGPCSAIIFNIFSDDNHGVSEYHFQVMQPACNDSFSTSNWYVVEF